MKSYTIGCILISTYFLAGCKKTSEDPLLTYTIVVESGNATGGITANNCYVDLHGGKAYAYDEAKTKAAQVDFFYYYNVYSFPPPYFRGLTNIRMSVSSAGFDTLTYSLMEYCSHRGITMADFNNLETSQDIDHLQEQKQIVWTTYRPMVYLSTTADDSPYENIFAFITNSGKKGFFTVLPYTSQVSANDKAAITLIVKIQK